PFGIADEEFAKDPVKMYLNDIFTVTVNMAGLPGMSVPAGLDANGLPLGLQLIGRPFDEETLFRAGHVIEPAAGRFEPQCRWSEPSHFPDTTDYYKTESICFPFCFLRKRYVSLFFSNILGSHAAGQHDRPVYSRSPPGSAVSQAPPLNSGGRSRPVHTGPIGLDHIRSAAAAPAGRPFPETRSGARAGRRDHRSRWRL